ncbi:hypothetical protein COX25_03875 [bacterium (Candidatus Howlettbacteria) CG23_combo_of_CG06-09_8_20_14_all_37_9]|nr:MAG: hypothetical protein COX25_03875 [bacterium (Candidatus Howlettbacteria) CG23_combo_of_CG06-09_8_20_14_all_37_9]
MKKYLVIILLIAILLPTGCNSGQSQIVGNGTEIAYTGDVITFDFMKKAITGIAMVSNLNTECGEIGLGSKVAVGTDRKLNIYKQMEKDKYIQINSIERRLDYGYWVDCSVGEKGASWLRWAGSNSEDSPYRFDTSCQIVTGIDPQKFYQTDENNVEIHFFTTPILTPPAISYNKGITDPSDINQKFVPQGGAIEWIAYFKKNMAGSWILDRIDLPRD